SRWPASMSAAFAATGLTAALAEAGTLWRSSQVATPVSKVAGPLGATESPGRAANTSARATTATVTIPRTKPLSMSPSPRFALAAELRPGGGRRANWESSIRPPRPLEGPGRLEAAGQRLDRMDLEVVDPVDRFAGQARGVVEGRGVGLDVGQVEGRGLQLEVLVDLVAEVDVDLAVALVLGELVAVADRIGAEVAPLQAAEPRPEVVEQDAERADEGGGVGDEGTVEAVGGQVAGVAGLGPGQVRVELQPAGRPVLGGQLHPLA